MSSVQYSDFAPPRMDNGGRVSHGSDDDAFVVFSDEPVQHPAESDKAGRPVFVDQLFVSVEFPGNRLSKFKSLATDEHKARWPNAYRRYLENTKASTDGWPLEEWPVMTRADVENMKLHRIYTVEQLAGVSDVNIGNLGTGIRLMRDKAQNALKQAKDGAAVSSLTAENTKLRLEVERLSRQVAELATGVNAAPQVNEEAIAAAVERALASKAKKP